MGRCVVICCRNIPVAFCSNDVAIFIINVFRAGGLSAISGLFYLGEIDLPVLGKLLDTVVAGIGNIDISIA